MTTTIACITQFPLHATAPDECVLDLRMPYRNPFPVRAAELQVADLIVASLGLVAAKDGCDAILVNTLADYGVDHLRRFLRGPVVGAGYAAYAAASCLAERWSVVSVWPPSLRWVHDLKLRDYGVADRCASVRFVTSDATVATGADRRTLLLETRACDPRLLERTAAESIKAIEEDGAEAIVLGCTCMAGLRDQLAAALPVPVIDPEAAGVALVASLARTHGPLAFRSAGAIEDVATSTLVAELGTVASRLLA